MISALKKIKYSGGIKLRVIVRLCKLINFFSSKIGINVIASHFYSPIPNLKEIKKERFTKKPKEYSFESLNLDLNKQETYLSKLIKDVNFLPEKNTGLSLFDSYFLYSFVKKNMPKKIIEIGCGETTKIIQSSLKENNIKSQHICIEPYISLPFDKFLSGKGESVKLINKKVQEVSTDLFCDCDFLFIDSSHIVKTDSDVLYEFFEIIPKLKKGTVVHFHDIMIPYAYWLEWHKSGTQYWNESYFLHSFLMYNNAWETLFSSRFYQQNKFLNLKKYVPFLQNNHRNSSYYIQKIN